MFIAYTIISYCCLSSLQNNCRWFYIGTFSNYFFTKVMMAIFLGWLIVPVWVLALLIGKLKRN